MLLFSRNISLVLRFLVLVPSTVGFGLIQKEESQRVLRTKLGDIKDKTIHLVGSSNGSSRYHTEPSDIQLIQRQNGTSPKKQRHSKRDQLTEEECQKLSKFGVPTELSV